MGNPNFRGYLVSWF